MDEENMTLEEKCEHLMNIVVESRKRFGKLCVDYEQKSAMMENKMLNLQLETIKSYKFKSKQNIQNVDVEAMYKDLEGVDIEITERRKRIEALTKNIQNTQTVILQMKKDQIEHRCRRPLTAEAMLDTAINKNCS